MVESSNFGDTQMIHNLNCAYCGVLMNRIENHEHCVSVEHMIPNAASKMKRNNSGGDFNVCRKCNIGKSRMDEVMGITTRLALNSETNQNDLEKFKERIKKNDKLFMRAAKSLSHLNDGYGFSLPITVSQAINYFEHFAKGQYLINTGSIYSPSNKLIIIDIYGSQTLKIIEQNYTKRNNTDPFEDLTINKNDGVYNLFGETFIITSEDTSNMFMIFNRTLLIKINILPNTRKNLTLKNKAKRELYHSWNRA